MYNFSELTAMPDTEVARIAETMGLKKLNHADKEAMIFGILDKQAADHAQSVVAQSKGEQRPKRERIGRKVEKTATARPDENSAVENITAADGNEAPRRRGRKPKNAQASRPAEEKPLEMPRIDSVDPSLLPAPQAVTATVDNNDSEAVDEMPKGGKKRGRKPKHQQPLQQPREESAAADPLTDEILPPALPFMTPPEEQPDNKETKEADEPSAGEPSPAAAPKSGKKRGRKSNAQKAAEAAAAAAAAETATSTPEATLPAIETPAVDNEGDAQPADAQAQPADDAKQKAPQRDFMPAKDSSFGSFFPRGEGRRFVPRSQKEREEAQQQPRQRQQQQQPS